MKTCYRLFIEGQKDKDIIVLRGIKQADVEDSEAVSKFNKGLSVNMPMKHCVPYYKNGYFSFASKNALCTFLYDKCKLSNEDILSLVEDFKLRCEKLTLSVWACGLSKMYAQYFNDEVEDSSEVDLVNLVNGTTYVQVGDPDIEDGDIDFCKERYYTNF